MEPRKAEEDNRLRTNSQGPQKIAGSEEERVLRSNHGKANKRRRMKKKEGCRLKIKDIAFCIAKAQEEICDKHSDTET
jgi:hypothetical protein